MNVFVLGMWCLEHAHLIYVGLALVNVKDIQVGL